MISIRFYGGSATWWEERINEMRRGSKLIATFLAAVWFGGQIMADPQHAKTYQDTRKLLAEMTDRVTNRSQLARLFRVGDERIADLIELLDDQNPEISLRSQVIIRYLGNEVGMKGLFDWYGKRQQFPVTGPVPLPLKEWDYQTIYARYIGKPVRSWTLAEPYIYALALDDSAKPSAVLAEMVEGAGDIDDSLVAGQAIKRVKEGHPKQLLRGRGDLVKLVLRNAFFVSPEDRQHASARLLSFNGRADKALIEVYINQGALAEQWYHVVVEKCRLGWRFFSVSPVAVS